MKFIFSILSRGILARTGILAGLFSAALCFCALSAEASVITIPNLVKVVEESAFEGDSSITEVILPASVEAVNQYAFSGCTNLEKITVSNSKTILQDNSIGTTGDAHIISGGYPFTATSGSYATTAYSYAKKYGLTYQITGTNSMLTPKRSKLIEYAASLIGTPYSELDCVTFVHRCYRKALNITIQNTCDKIYLQTTTKNPGAVQITKITALQPGDIICWQDDNSNKIDDCEHVGMYVGAGYVNNKYYSSGVFIESSHGHGGVRYNYLPSSGSNYYRRNFLCAWRIIDN